MNKARSFEKEQFKKSTTGRNNDDNNQLRVDLLYVC